MDLIRISTIQKTFSLGLKVVAQPIIGRLAMPQEIRFKRKSLI